MHKKGALITLEAIVKLLPHILLTIAALAILFGMIAMIFIKEKTPAETDFKRVKEEFDILVKREYKSPISFEVPLTAQTSYRIILYNRYEAPKVCMKQSCLCLYDYNSEKQLYVETCVPYDKLAGECTGDCNEPCVPATNQVEIIKERTFTLRILRMCGAFSIA